ncbi:dermonecrotic toxin domain-containing protein [Burkholderia pyrrocinia]
MMEIRSNQSPQHYPEVDDQSVVTENGQISKPPSQPTQEDRQVAQTEPPSSNGAEPRGVSPGGSQREQIGTPFPVAGDTGQALTIRRKRQSPALPSTDLERAQMTVAQADQGNAEVLRRMGSMPSVVENEKVPELDVEYDTVQYQEKLTRHWQEPVKVRGHTDTRANQVAYAQRDELTHRAALGVQDKVLAAADKTRIDQLRARPDKETRDAQQDSPGVYALSLTNQSESAEFSGLYAITERAGPNNPLQGEDKTGVALLVAPGQPIEKFVSMQALETELKARLQNPSKKDSLLQHIDPGVRQKLASATITLGARPIEGDVFVDRLKSEIQQQDAEVFAASQDLELHPDTYQDRTESEVLSEAANKIIARHDLTSHLNERDETLLLSGMRQQGLGWLADAPAADRAEYLAAEGYRRQAQLNVDNVLQEAGSPRTHVSNQARDYIQAQYGVEVDPKTVQVKVEYRVQDGETSRTTSLADLLQEGPRNSASGELSYSVVTPAGQTPILSKTQLDATLQNVDARKGYSEALRTKYQDPELSSAQIDHQDAKLQEAALAAKLKGQISDPAYEMIQQVREQDTNNPSATTTEGLSISLPVGQRAMVKGAMLFRRGGENGQPERLVLFAPGAEDKQTVYEFQNRQELSQKVAEWLKDDTGRRYLKNQLDPAHHKVAEQFFDEVSRLPSSWKADQVSTNRLSGETYLTKLGMLVDGQNSVKVAEAEAAVSPKAYQNATLEERRAYTNASEKARLTTQLLDKSTGVPSFDEFARETIAKQLNDVWRPQVRRGERPLNPDDIEVDLLDGQPRRTLTDIGVHGYDSSVKFGVAATFSSRTGQDVSWMNRRDGRGAHSHSPFASTVAGYARGSYLGDAYVESIINKANGDLSDHRDLTRQSIQASMRRDALEAKFKGDLTPEQYQSVSTQIEKLSTTDAGPGYLPTLGHDAPAGMYQFTLGGRSIEGTYVLRGNANSVGTGQARDLLYTPGAPDGKVFRAHDSLTKPVMQELSQYFYDRVKVNDQRTVGSRLDDWQRGTGQLDKVGSGGRVSDLGREFDKKRDRIIDDVRATTKSRADVIKEQVWKGVGYAGAVFSIAVPPVGAAFGAATAFKSLGDGIDAERRGDKSAALGYFASAALDVFGAIGDAKDGIKALRVLNPGVSRHLGSLEDTVQTLKHAERITESTTSGQAAQSVLTRALAVKRPPKELTLQQGGLLDGTYAGPVQENGFRSHYIKDGDRYFQVKPDTGMGTLRVIDPRRPDAFYQMPIVKQTDGTWQYNNVGLRGGMQPNNPVGGFGGDRSWDELSSYAAPRTARENAQLASDGLLEEKSILSRLPFRTPRNYVEIDGILYQARRNSDGSARLIDGNNANSHGPLVTRKNGKWTAQFEAGTTPLGNSVNFSRNAKYPKSYMVNGDPKFLVEEGNLVISNGRAIIKDSERLSVLNSYDKWINNDLDLYRGISTNHFSISDMKNYGILKSEGDADIPVFTMGNVGGQKTAWLPADLQVDTPAMISTGNQMWLNGASDQNIPRGIVVKIRAGQDDSHFGVSFLNSGELVVQGPLSNSEYSIAGVVFDSKNGDIVMMSPKTALSFQDLPNPGPYPDPSGAKWTPKQVADWREEMRVWHQQFMAKRPVTVWSMMNGSISSM